MLKDCCVICKSLKTEKIEIASAFKRGELDLVVIKKINKRLCSAEEVQSIKSQIFLENFIDEIENDHEIIRVEKYTEWDKDIVVSSIKNSDDGIVFLKDGAYIHSNRKFREMLSEVTNTEDIGEIEKDKVFLEIKSRADMMKEKSLSKLNGHSSFRISDSKKRYFFEINRTKEDNSVMVVCKDRTKKYIAEKNLSNVNQRLSAVLESSRSGVFEMNGTDSKHIWISYNIYKILGYDEHKSLISYEKVKARLHEDDINYGFDKISEDVVNRKILCRDLRIKDNSGMYRWFSMVAYAIKKDDGNSKVVGSITDIHDKKMASMSLQNSEKALEEERELNKLITEFFSNISHDFKTPLNLITNSLKLLKNSMSISCSESEQIDRYFEIIQQNCFRLIKLVNNLLDITRIESGFYSLSLNNGNIVNSVEETTLSVREYTNNRGINLIFDTDMEEEIICYDHDKVERIMLNLLSNSIKFTETGGKILVKVSKDDKSVQIRIKDTGMGIPKNKLQRIFNRFEQAHDINTGISGTGIGLSLVKSLVELHEGQINIDSIEGVGTDIKLYLPLRSIENDDSKVFMRSNFDIDKVFVELSDVCQL